MNKKAKKYLSIILVFAMLFTLLPANLPGAGMNPMVTRALAVEGVPYLDGNGQRAYQEATQVTSSTETMTTGWYYVTGDVSRRQVTVNGDVKLILGDGCHLAINGSGLDMAGILVTGGNSLTIYANSTDEATMGKLTAYSPSAVSSSGAGIGGGIRANNNSHYGNITIYGGKIDARGGGGSGIGGGADTEYGGDISIHGGIVKAEGRSDRGAGIGASDNPNTDEGSGTIGNITITGGDVTAIGNGWDVPAIGCRTGTMGDILITGGVISATENTGTNTLVIGTSCGVGGNITIKDCVLKARSGGSGIGTHDGKIGDITIINSDIEVNAGAGQICVGIGSGSETSIAGNIVIEGSKIYTSAEGWGSCIGTDSGVVGDITITNTTGTIYNGNIYKEIGVGIGAHEGGKTGNITINGGVLTVGTSDGIAIGTYKGEVDNITLNADALVVRCDELGIMGIGAYEGFAKNITILGGTNTIYKGWKTYGHITYTKSVLVGWNYGDNAVGSVGSFELTGGSLFYSTDHFMDAPTSGGKPTALAEISGLPGIEKVLVNGVDYKVSMNHAKLNITQNNIWENKVYLYLPTERAVHTITVKTATGTKIYTATLAADGKSFDVEQMNTADSVIDLGLNQAEMLVEATASSGRWAFNPATRVITLNSGSTLMMGSNADDDYRVVVNSSFNDDINFYNVGMQAMNGSGSVFKLQPGASVNLVQGGQNVLQAGSAAAGLGVPNGAAITIDGTGTLNATGGSNGAGIGGDGGDIGGIVTINGSTVVATGGSGAENIEADEIVIVGGSVNAATTSTTPTNGSANGNVAVACTTLTIAERASQKPTAVELYSIKTGAVLSYYNTDVEMDAEGKLYFWLPTGDQYIVTAEFPDSVEFEDSEYKAAVTAPGTAIVHPAEDQGTGTLTLEATATSNQLKITSVPPVLYLAKDQLTVDGTGVEITELLNLGGGVYTAKMKGLRNGKLTMEAEFPGMKWASAATEVVVDTVAPVPSAASPIKTSGTLTVQFDEAIDVTAGGTVSLNGDAAFWSGSEWTEGNTRLVLQYSGLELDTNYTLVVSEFSDVYGNVMTTDGTFTVSTLKDPKLSNFAQATLNLTYGDGVTPGQTISSAEGMTIAYASSDEDVVKVNAATGALTVMNAGTAIITAATAETATHAAASKTYEVAVGQYEIKLNTVVATDRVYDKTVDVALSASAVNVASLPGGGSIAFEPFAGTMENANAGMDKVVQVGAPSLTAAYVRNYTITEWPQTTTVSISKAAPVLGAVTYVGDSIDLDTDVATVSSGLVGSGADAAEGVLSLTGVTAFTVVGVGTYDWSFDSDNYNTVTGTIQLEVNDSLPPHVIRVEPSGLIPLEGEIVIQFSEEMDPDGGGRVSLDGGETYLTDGIWNSPTNDTVTFPYSGLDKETNYEVIIEGFADKHGNSMEPDNTASVETKKDPELQSFDMPELNLTFGDEPHAGQAVDSENGCNVTYESSNPEVVRVDPDTGELIVVGAGEVTITAKSEEDGTFAEDTKTYEVVVAKRAIVVENAVATNRVYDGTVDVAVDFDDVISPVNGASITIHSVVGTMDDANVGENKAVAVPKPTMDAAFDANYEIAEWPSVMAVTITKRAPDLGAVTYTGSAIDQDSAVTVVNSGLVGSGADAAKGELVLTGVSAFTIMGESTYNWMFTSENYSTLTGTIQLTIHDTLAPVVTSVSPVTGGTDMPPSGTITVTFSEAMEENSGSIALSTNGLTFDVLAGGAWNSATSYSVQYEKLGWDGTYLVKIEGFADLAGNTIQSALSSFTIMAQPEGPYARPQSLGINEGATGNITVSLGLPWNRADSASITINDPAVASISASTLMTDGTITVSGLSRGTAVITVTFDSAETTYEPVEIEVTVAGYHDIVVAANPVEGGNPTFSPAGRALAGTVITLSANPALYYKFMGWVVESGDVVIAANNTFVMPDEDVSITAQYEFETYTVTFDPNGGERVNGGELVQEIVVTQAADAPEVERKGYRFLGWDHEFDNVMGDMTVTAVWQRLATGGNGGGNSGGSGSGGNNGNSGSNGSGNNNQGGDVIKYPDGKEVTVPDGSVLEKNGDLIFNGDGGVIKYPDGKEVIVPDGSVLEKNGDLVFNGDGGVIKYPDGKEITVPDGSVLEKDGDLVFNGDGGVIKYPDGTVVTVPEGSILDRDGILVIGDGGGTVTTEGGTVAHLSGGSKVDGNNIIVVGEGGAIVISIDGKRTELPEGIIIMLDDSAALGFVVIGLVHEDVNAEDWFFDDITFVYMRGLMFGTSKDPWMFSPKMELSRAMIVTILYNLAGTPAAGQSTFKDVAADAWYADAVAWAQANNVVAGYGNGNFGPNESVTREDLAVILANYVQYKLPAIREDEKFADAAAVSDYAREATSTLFRAGIVGGKPGNLFDPKGFATRAEAASMLRRFVEAIEQQ